MGPMRRSQKDACSARFFRLSAQRHGNWFFSNEVGGEPTSYLIYYTNAARNELYFVTSVPNRRVGDARIWSAKGDVKELRKAYEGFHPEFAPCSSVPGLPQVAISNATTAALERWTVVAVGRACHPMTPYGARRSDCD